MQNRLSRCLTRAQRDRKKLLCAYLTLGYPSLNETRRTILALERDGVDILELGFPFSDPLADGPIIQHAAQVAINKGVNISDAFRLMKQLRSQGLTLPVVFFSYLNPILKFGVQNMAVALRKSGFDGMIVPDLPPEEGTVVKRILHKHGLLLTYLIAPTTNLKRMKKIEKASDGFIYYVSVRGVTGTRHSVAGDLRKNLALLKRATKKPILVGFGVSDAKQARAVTKMAHGIVVGSALVSRMGTQNSSKRVDSFVRGLVRAIQ
jgi:tryptophan synthase alpha chain